MKQILLILLLFPVFCSAQTKYTEKELWNGVPAEKLPLDHLELILKYNPPKPAGIPGREYMRPHDIGVGLRNTGNRMVEEIDVSLIFFNETAITHLKTPDGKILDYIMQRGFRGRFNWQAIQPGEETWYCVMPLWDWFPEVKTSDDGRYEMWWEIGTHTSDKLILHKYGQEISPSNDSEQPALANPPQSAGHPAPDVQ